MLNALLARLVSPAIASLLWTFGKPHLVALFEEAEAAFSDPGTGAFKKESVITAINAKIDIPGISEENEQIALRVILGPVIDRAVSWWQREKADRAAGVTPPG